MDYQRPKFLFIGKDECNLGEQHFVRGWNKLDAWAQFKHQFASQYNNKITPKYWDCSPYQP